MGRVVASSAALACLACGNSSAPAAVHYSREQLLDPQTCRQCHQQTYADWSGSMHAYASDDPLFVAMNLRAQDFGKVGGFCVKCHAPVAFQLGQTVDGTNLSGLPQSMKGVTCYFCHTVEGVLATHTGASLADASTDDRPLHFADDGVMRGGFDDPVPNQAHAAAYSSLHDGTRLGSSRLCGSCHDVVNDHGAPIERTFAEWSGTLFNSTVGGDTCNHCHMPTSVGVAADSPGVFARTLHDHKFPGVDLALTIGPGVDPQQAAAQRQAVEDFLDTELSTALCVATVGPSAQIFIIADNVAAGHSWPSGAAQDRRAWFQVVASVGGSPIYQSGVVPIGTDPSDLKDDDLWLLRDCMVDGQGNVVSTFWDAVGPSDSNTLPGAVTIDRLNPLFYNTHVKQTYPRAASSVLSTYPDMVTLDVKLLAFSLDLFDDLFLSSPAPLKLSSADVQGLRARLIPMSVGKTLTWTPAAAMDPTRGGSVYLDQTTGQPVSCVSTGVNAQANWVPAPRHTVAGCKP